MRESEFMVGDCVISVYGLSVDGKDTGYNWDENWFEPIQEINEACLAEFDSLL